MSRSPRATVEFHSLRKNSAERLRSKTGQLRNPAKLTFKLTPAIKHPAIPVVAGAEVVRQQTVFSHVTAGILSEPLAEWDVPNQSIEKHLKLVGRMIDQTGLAIADRALVDRRAGQSSHAVPGTFDELEVRLVLVEPRRLQRQEGNVGRMQQLVVALVRAKRLERFVRCIQGIEEGPVVNDLNSAHRSPCLASTRFSTGKIGAQSASRLSAPKKSVAGPDAISASACHRRSAAWQSGWEKPRRAD